MSHIRTSVKIFMLMIIAGIMILGITMYIYKPTYSVTLNGEFIGYTRDKSGLQAKINNAIQQGTQDNVAFIQVDNMPEYELCMLKKDVQTNDDQIYDKIVNQGTQYYRYYALLENGEEKYYFSTFLEAEDVVNQLKEKDSSNKDDLTVLEKYSVEMAQLAQIDTSVNELYKEKVVINSPKVASSSRINAPSAKMGSSATKLNIGITLVRPLAGTITSRYGIRSRDNHKGLDIAASYGAPIYAAAAGTVTTASSGTYGGGYGTHLMITHSNGVQTLYGHCSSLVVSKGQTVSQGQLIARVGSTGLSTGNHLHFEVRVNGVTQDPQNYVY